MIYAASSLALPLAEDGMTWMQVYADAPGQSADVWQLGNRASDAAAEIEQLFRELLPDAVTTPSAQEPTTEEADRRPKTPTDGLVPPAISTSSPSIERQFINGAKSAAGDGVDAMRIAATDASGASLSNRIRPEYDHRSPPHSQRKLTMLSFSPSVESFWYATVATYA